MAGTESTVGRLRYAAAFAAGPVEVMDFLLPLWAADEIDASPAAIGAVVALEAALSLAVRPLAGVLADRHDRRLLAAAGAALYAASFLLYAAAPGIALVALGAAIGGAGGALFWVALRAEAGTQLAVDPAAYARLLSGEQYGSLARVLRRADAARLHRLPAALRGRRRRVRGGDRAPAARPAALRPRAQRAGREHPPRWAGGSRRCSP